MNKWLFACVGFLSCLTAPAQQPATVKEYRQSFTTYPYSDPNPIASFTKVYPYFRYDGFTNTPVQKEWTVVALENDYIKVLILPEIGGKIWSAIEKSSGRPFIYFNHVVKFRDIAMRGPWTSGGIEANYGIIGHTPNCATPVDYLTRTNPDGSASCLIGVLDRLTRTSWRIEIHLPKDKAYFTTRSFWYNDTPLEQPYYHWMNAGIKAGGNLEFIFPGTSYVGHDGEYAEWPVHKANGKNLSFYEQNNFGGYKSYHVFGRYTDFFGGYWHKDDLGMARYASHADKAGKKIWIWGLSRQGMIWEKLLTDTDGQYVEVQSGRLFNQSAEKSTLTPFKHKGFAPYSTDEWTEYWYPVLATKGFVKANEYGALNMKYEDGWLKVYFSPVQRLKDTLQIKEGDRVIYQKGLALTPLNTFSDSLPVRVNPLALTVTLGGGKLVYQAQPEAQNLDRPVKAPEDFDWNSVYGLYRAGKEFMDQKMYVPAEEKLNAALQKDPYFLPALVKMAELQYRNLRYDAALQYARSALSIDTHDGAANYYYGLIQAHLGKVTEALDGFDVACLSPEYRSAAFTELGKLYVKEQRYDKAVESAARALDFNRYNMAAYQTQAVAYRYLNDSAEAGRVLNTILSLDPLNHFARFELYLWRPSEANRSRFVSLIRSEQPEETFLELAVAYYTSGCMKEAETLLRLSPSTAIVDYWLAYVQSKQAQDFSGQLAKAGHSSPAFVFPFRSETADMLQWARRQSKDWKIDYFLSLIYKDRGRIAESAARMQSLGTAPDYAPFYGARAALWSPGEPQRAEADLARALALDKKEWRYHKLLAEHYLGLQQEAKALAVAESCYRALPSNYIIGMLYAKTLLLNRRYEACDQLLAQLNIIPFEGATEGRELYREAKLMQALQQLKGKKYKKALLLIAAARQWPENLGVGKPYEQDVDERLEDWMSYRCYEQMGNTKAARHYVQKILAFTPRVENTVRHFIAANHLITAWAMAATNGRQPAAQWLGEQIRHDPENKQVEWVQAVFAGGKKELPVREKDATIRILEQLEAL